MKISLQLYGQLRTFKKTLPSLLNFIDYYNNDYDVFILIDKGTTNINPAVKSNYSEDNLNSLKNLLIPDRIKFLKFTDEFTEEEKQKENEEYMKYHKIHSNLSIKNNTKYTKDDFVPRLVYRKYKLNQYKNLYIKTHTINYDYAITSRFDIGTTLNNKYIINEQTTPLMCSDVLTIAKPEFIDIETNLGNSNFPFTPTLFFDADYNRKIEMENKYMNFNVNRPGIEFLYTEWVFMPELNYRLFVLEHGLNFIEGWWQGGTTEFPHNFGFQIIRD